MGNNSYGKIGFLYAITQVHAGKGFDVGIVDQPIQREIHTHFPVINGVKGAIRNELGFHLKDNEEKIFGSSYQDNENSEAGKVSFSEAKIAFYPVRSIDRGIVWVTCPLILSRMKIAFEIVDNKSFVQIIDKILEEVKNEKVLSTIDSQKVCLEEFEENVSNSEDLKILAEKLENIFPDKRLHENFLNNLIVLKNDDFSYFIENSTEVIARIRIDKEKKVVTPGALWYEEYVPQDTIFYFVSKVLYGDEKNYIIKEVSKLGKKYMNIGGKASIGKGLVYLTFLDNQ